MDEYIEDFPSERLIDSINPLSWFKTGKVLVKRRYDLVIFRFWNPFFAPALGVIAGVIKKNSPATKLISLCDNIFPHEKAPFSHFFISIPCFWSFGYLTI